MRQAVVLSQPQFLSVCNGGPECGGSLALYVCRMGPTCRNNDLYSYQRRRSPTREETANLDLVPTAFHSSRSGGSTAGPFPGVAPPMAIAAVDQGQVM